LVDVTDGYARNFLVPRGLAMKASKGVESQASAMRRSRDVRDAADRSAAEEVAKVLVPQVINVSAKAGAEGRLFGSVTAADVVDAVEAQTGVLLDRRTLHIDEPIKSLGTHTVPAKLHADVEFVITLEVAAL
ncbi:MAG TPA: 50S ribosomal protein L9, partial [Acidimicrobiales bacterium]